MCNHNNDPTLHRERDNDHAPNRSWCFFFFFFITTIVASSSSVVISVAYYAVCVDDFARRQFYGF